MRAFGFILALSICCAVPCAAAGDGPAPTDSTNPIDLDGITTTASRKLTLQPDQATINVTARTQSASKSAQILQALNGTGILASDIQSQDKTYFSFRFTRPLEALPALLTKLQSLEAQSPQGMTISFDAAFTLSATAKEQLRETVVPQLVAEARRKAQAIANAAGLTLGPVQSVSDDSAALGPRAIYVSAGGLFGAVLPPYRVAPVRSIGIVAIAPPTTFTTTYYVTARFAAN